jgi:mannose/fructose/N-acetylgalactosamine-specific phosphotransferase system component IID
LSPESPKNDPLKMGTLDLISAFARTLFLQTVWNFERYLNYGVAFVLCPVLRRLYPKEERGQALGRHLDYFNTHPYMGSFILGAIIKMEEERAQTSKAGQKQKEDEINALKVGMMGPLAAVGDNFFWATIRPYCGLLAVTLVMTRAMVPQVEAWAVPLLFLVSFNIVHLGMRFLGFRLGYKKGDQVVLSLRRFGLQEAIRGIRIASVLLVAVVIVFVNRTDLESQPGNFLIKLVFFVAILGLFAFALHRKISPGQLFYAAVLFALLLNYWPILSATPDMPGVSSPEAVPSAGITLP